MLKNFANGDLKGVAQILQKREVKKLPRPQMPSETRLVRSR